MIDNKSFFNSFNCVNFGNLIYFVGSDLNLIFTYNKNDQTLSILNPPDEKMNTVGLYGNAVVVSNDLYLIPLNSDFIWGKNVLENDWVKISCPSRARNNKFYGATIYDNSIFLFGYSAPEVKRFDVDSKKVSDLEISGDINEKDIGEKGFLSQDYTIRGGKIYVPLMFEGSVAEIDPLSNQVKLKLIDGNSRGFAGIAFDGDGYWLPPRVGNLCVHLDSEFKVKEYRLPGINDDEEMRFGGAYFDGQEVFFTSFCSENYCFSKDDFSGGEYFMPSIYYCKNFGSEGRVIHHRNKDIVFYDQFNNSHILDINNSNMFKLESGYFHKYFRQEIVYENGIFGIQHLIDI